MVDAPIRVRASEVATAESLQPRARDAKGRIMPRAKPVQAAPEAAEVDVEVNNGVKRIPLGQHVAKLSYPVRPGYVRRWVSEIPGRIERALGAGWSHVKDPNTKKPVGQVVDQSLGEKGRRGYLMEIPEALYDEDQKVKQDSLDEVDKLIDSGKYNERADDKRYNPTFAPNKKEVRLGPGVKV